MTPTKPRMGANPPDRIAFHANALFPLAAQAHTFKGWADLAEHNAFQANFDALSNLIDQELKSARPTMPGDFTRQVREWAHALLEVFGGTGTVPTKNKITRLKRLTLQLFPQGTLVLPPTTVTEVTSPTATGQPQEATLEPPGASADELTPPPRQTRSRTGDHPGDQVTALTILDEPAMALQAFPEFASVIQAALPQDMRHLTINETLALYNAICAVTDLGEEWFAITDDCKPPDDGTFVMMAQLMHPNSNTWFITMARWIDCPQHGERMAKPGWYTAYPARYNDGTWMPKALDMKPTHWRLPKPPKNGRATGFLPVPQKTEHMPPTAIELGHLAGIHPNEIVRFTNAQLADHDKHIAHYVRRETAALVAPLSALGGAVIMFGLMQMVQRTTIDQYTEVAMHEAVATQYTERLDQMEARNEYMLDHPETITPSETLRVPEPRRRRPGRVLATAPRTVQTPDTVDEGQVLTVSATPAVAIGGPEDPGPEPGDAPDDERTLPFFRLPDEDPTNP